SIPSTSSSSTLWPYCLSSSVPLERLSKPSQQAVEAYEGTAKMEESQMNVVTTLIADGQPTVGVEPGEGALYYPPVPAQRLAALYPLTCYAACNASLIKSRSAPAIVIRLVSVPLVRAKARASRLTKWTFDRLDSVHHLFKHHRVVSVGTRQPDRQRDTPSLDHNLALRARFSLLC